MNVFERYKPLRNKCKQLAWDDSFYVIWAYSQFLQVNGFQIPKDIETSDIFLNAQPRQKYLSEWELELLAREVLLNGFTESSKNKSLKSWAVLSELMNSIKSLEEEIYAQYGSDKNVLLELVRVAHRQFPWQGNPPNDKSTIRYFRIFDEPTINTIAQERLGLSILELFGCGFCLMGSFITNPATKWPIASTIRELPVAKFETFLKFTSRPIAALIELVRKEQLYNDRYAYAYNSLRAFPIVRMVFRGGDAIVCPMPTLLFWRITNGLYYELITDPRFPNAYGHSFQSYVGEAVQRAISQTKIGVLGEQQYFVGKQRKDSTDWIIFEEDKSAIFLECKAKRLTSGSKSALQDTQDFEADIEHLGKSIVQTYQAIVEYQNNHYPHFPFVAERQIYPVVVTLENWHIMGPYVLRLLDSTVHKQLQEAKLPDHLVDQFPYSVWAVEELEIASQVIAKVGLSTFMKGKIDDPQLRQWSLHGYMSSRFGQLYPFAGLFEPEFNNLFAGLTAQME